LRAIGEGGPEGDLAQVVKIASIPPYWPTTENSSRQLSNDPEIAGSHLDGVAFASDQMQLPLTVFCPNCDIV
jgi:hypothetical protein